MAGGSREQESEDEQQCQHCGLWFGSEGVLNHEKHCDLAGFDARKVELVCPVTILRADDVEVEEVASPESESPEEVASEASPTTPEEAGGDPAEGRVEDGMRADGGPMEIPEFGEDDEAGADGAESEATCPGCDRPASSEEVETPREALPDEVLERHGELKTVDHICRPCSTDADGNWTSPVEVFNADA